MVRDVPGLLDAVVEWAGRRPSVRGVALVGSHARGSGGTDSDVDLVLLVARRDPFLVDASWTAEFGDVVSMAEEAWGAVTALRVFYRQGPEVEFGLATPDWARLPVDAGTRRVVEDGMAVLYDPDGGLARLRAAVCG